MLKQRLEETISSLEEELAELEERMQLDGDWNQALAVSFMVDCPYCGETVALTDLGVERRCRECLSEFSVPFDHLVAGLLAEKAVERNGMQLKTRRCQPLCGRCGALLRIDAGAGVVSCSACGVVQPGAPPPWLSAAFPSLRSLVPVEHCVGRPLNELNVEAAPVVMACPSCGGSLRFTAETKRTTVCHYCEVQVYLPDAVWRTLHPAVKATVWTLLYRHELIPADGLEQRRIEYQSSCRDARRKLKRKQWELMCLISGRDPNPKGRQQRRMEEALAKQKEHRSRPEDVEPKPRSRPWMFGLLIIGFAGLMIALAIVIGWMVATAL